MSEKKILYKILVKGHVQGVGFRQSCLREARFRGICGFVENRTDGSVYIEAEAYNEVLEGFLTWLNQRPGYGSVEDISVETGVTIHYKSFIIRY